MKTLKNILSVLVACVGLSFLTVLTPVSAAPVDDACVALNRADPSASCDSASADSGFQKIIKNIINVLSIIAGTASVIMIIIGGFRYIISNGDQNGVQGAKNTILYAIVGLVIVLFAQLIVRFVFTNASP